MWVRRLVSVWQRLRQWLGSSTPDAADPATIQATQATQADSLGLNAERFAAAVAPMAFITGLPADEQTRLRRLCAGFLASKEFQGVLGLTVSDDMAIAIAAQACLPLLHLGPPHAPEQALRWYSGFVGIVLAPHELPVQRHWQDEAGVMHEDWDVVSGEASEDGPVMLSWHDVQVGMGVLRLNFLIHSQILTSKQMKQLAMRCTSPTRPTTSSSTSSATRSTWPRARPMAARRCPPASWAMRVRPMRARTGWPC